MPEPSSATPNDPAKAVAPPRKPIQVPGNGSPTPAAAPSSGGAGANVPPPPSGGNTGETSGNSAGGGGGNIAEVQIERELQDSYLTYAMSTIMDRALPDVRDGLKPSQRRLLVAMNDLNLRPGRKHMKCAKIVGETMGNYHPHGDLALYGTLVGMAQKWRMRTTHVDPQGNFGSIDGDAPASMRYTEARMTQAAVDMLEDLKLETVDFQPNYDDRLMEPMVLPGKFPNLLINGGIGIAVGMATSLAPHNPTEILDAIVRVLEKPDISLQDLMLDEDQVGRVEDEDGTVAPRREGTKGTGGTGGAGRLGVKGPDFPTGGIILGRRGIIEAYATGRGRVTVRGIVHMEPIPGSKDRQQIVIDTIPYGLNQTSLIEKIKELVEDGKMEDVSDARNESGREAQSRVVIELKRNADAAVVENQLYQFTPLQTTFSIHNIALVNRQPRALSLKEMIGHYIDHRVSVIRRRTEYRLREAARRKHIVQGLVYAVCSIDEVIKLIRASATRDEAIEALMERTYRITTGGDVDAMLAKDSGLRDEMLKAGGPAGVRLTRVQADAIGGMRLIQLVNMEVSKLVEELLDLQGKIRDYNDILARRERVTAIIKADCDEMKSRYGSGPIAKRLTRIEDTGGDINIEALIQVEDVAVTISHQGYAKRVSVATYRQQGRGGKGIIAGAARDEDFIEHMFVANTHDDLLCFTELGRVFKMKVYELPDLPRTSKGRAMVNLIELKRHGGEGTKGSRDQGIEGTGGTGSGAVGGVEGEKAPGSEGGATGATPEPAAERRAAQRTEQVRAFLAVKNFEEGSSFLTFVSREGIVKRTPLKDYRNVNKSGIIAVGLKEGDEVLDVTLTGGNDDLLLATAQGMAIRFNEQDVRLMGRAAAGVKGIELADGDEVVGVVPIPMAPDSEGDMMTAPSALAGAGREAGAGLCLLTVTENGYGKRTVIDEYRVQPETGKLRSQSRGGKGRVDIDTGDRNGRAIAALGVKDGDDVVVISKNGQLVRMAASTIRVTGRGAMGVKVVGLYEGDKVVAAARVAGEE